MDKAGVLQLFEGIQAVLPHLKMEIDLHDPDVEIMMKIPAQDGLGFHVDSISMATSST